MRVPRSRRRATTLAVAAAGLLAGLVAQPAGAASAPAGFRPFADDSIWNLPLRNDVPIASTSATQVAWLHRTVKAGGAWINTTNCGSPLYWADAATPKVKVALDPTKYQDPALIKAWSSVPIPSSATPANCGDKNFAVLQSQSDGKVKLWEFFGATKSVTGAWTAKWGGVTQDVKADRGSASTLSWTDPTKTDIPSRSSKANWNVTASSISMAAGVITRDEIARGVIPHALALATPDAAITRRVWPAQRTDGGLTDPAAIPEGTQLRLDPAVDVDALAVAPIVKMLAHAAQTYGIVLRDRTWSATVFYSEPVPAGESSLITPRLDGMKLGDALAAFPWDQLRVVDNRTCTAMPCTQTNVATIDIDGTPMVGQTVRLDTSNSRLEQPRKSVRWDIDGNGTFERDSGRSVAVSLTPGVPGRRTIRVQITTADGRVTVGSRTVDIPAADGTMPATTAPGTTTPTTPTEPIPTTPTPVPIQPAPAPTATVHRPASVTSQYFYAYSGSSLLQALSGTLLPPGTPSGVIKAYTKSRNGAMTIDFGGGALPAGTTKATVTMWVDCAAQRCATIDALAADNTVLASARPAYGSHGWVTLSVPTTGALPRLKVRVIETAAAASGDAVVVRDVALR